MSLQNITLTAQKTAQWTNKEKNKYDGRIYGYTNSEAAEYIGFKISDTISPENITAAALVVTTISCNAGNVADVHLADYDCFDDGGQYEAEHDKVTPKYDAEVIASAEVSSSACAEVAFDVSSVFNGSVKINSGEVAFRLDGKEGTEQSEDNAWKVGTLTNGGSAPKLVLTIEN